FWSFIAPDSCFRLACLLSDFDVCTFIFTPSFKKFLVVPPPLYPSTRMLIMSVMARLSAGR
ncbi:hypothetical protein ACW3QO_003580, partial [Escherichia coli]